MTSDSDQPTGQMPPLLVAIEEDLHHGDLGLQHQHAQHMIAWSATATVSLRTGDRDWLVPPTHALFVPAGCPHQADVERAGRVYAILVEPEDRRLRWDEPAGVLITPLVRELMIYLGGSGAHPTQRLAAESLFLDLLEPVEGIALRLPVPQDPRVRVIYDSLRANPADRRDLAAWSVAANSSVRTLARLISRETGMTFAQWRTLLRVRAALTYLARGTPVGTTARAVGYRGPGAFAEAFRRVTGQQPGAYLRGDGLGSKRDA